MILFVIWLMLAFVAYRIPRFWLKDDLIANQRIWLLNFIMGRKPNVFRTKLHDLLDCPYCMSFWVAALATFITDRFVHLPVPVLFALAAWGLEPLIWRASEDPITVRIAVEGTVKHRESKYSGD